MRKVLPVLVAFALAGSASAQSVQHIQYGHLKEQVLDFYLPAKRHFATVVFVYGGGWHAPRSARLSAVGLAFQKAGYGCALVSHRLGPQYKFPAQAEDVASAFSWAKHQIAYQGGDLRHVYLMGHSSGAHLVTLVACDPKYLEKENCGLRDIAGVVALSTPTNLEPTGSPMGFGDSLMAGRGAETFARDPILMKGASPIQHVTKGSPPFLMFVGDHDYPALPGDDRAFADAVNKAGGTAKLTVVPNCDHMGTIQAAVDPTSAVYKEILRFLK